MKRSYFILTLLIFAFLTNAIAAKKSTEQILKQRSDAATHSIDMAQFDEFPNVNISFDFKGGIIWTESFETPRHWKMWTSEDLTVPRPDPIPSQWVTDDWNAYDGTAWRCADLSIGTDGGYDNHWYQVLDTPPLTLDEDATFSFYHRYNAEPPAGASDPYDAWDGMNVRISTDGGETFEVLPFSTYNVTSIWAFGHPDQGHNEGPGIPGWAGANDSWTLESIGLADYTGQQVILRFAFASDLAYSTADNPAMYGWQIDNIEVKTSTKTIFSNMGTDEDMTGKSNEFIPPPGGDLWHVVRYDTPVPALLPEFEPFGRYGAACQHGGLAYEPDSTYNPYMDNVFMTGPIHLPETSPIYLDYKYVPNFYDGDAFPDVEFFRPEVRHADSTEWEWIEDQPYVYSFGYNYWLQFTWTYGYPLNLSMFDLSRFAGEDIYLRFRFWSDYDQPIGPGLMLDDLVIYSPTREIPPPQNVTATPNPADISITVSWDPMHEEVVYLVYRAGGGSNSFQLISQQSGANQFVDQDINPYYEYQYVVLAVVQYLGESDPSNVASASVIPEGVEEIAYDDAEADGYYESESNQMVAVKFVPPGYPVTLTAFKVYLDKGNATGSAGRFRLLAVNDDGSPGAVLQTKNKSGLKTGPNVIEFNNPETIEKNGFYISYSRFRTSPYLAIDTDPVIDGNTFVDVNGTWEQQTAFDGMIHAFVDVSQMDGSIAEVVLGMENQQQIANKFTLAKNFPNPFNPQTNISFNVPAKAADQNVRLEVFNLLGQKVATLFNGKAKSGLNTVQWKGVNDAGNSVNSGIYIYRLSSKTVTLSNRMLLIK